MSDKLHTFSIKAVYNTPTVCPHRLVTISTSGCQGSSQYSSSARAKTTSTCSTGELLFAQLLLVLVQTTSPILSNIVKSMSVLMSPIPSGYSHIWGQVISLSPNPQPWKRCTALHMGRRMSRCNQSPAAAAYQEPLLQHAGLTFASMCHLILSCGCLPMA